MGILGHACLSAHCWGHCIRNRGERIVGGEEKMEELEGGRARKMTRGERRGRRKMTRGRRRRN
jgi:hypothetical protein